MILEKSLGFKDAPPTKAPSTFSKDKISFAFSALTDPPYNIETFLAKLWLNLRISLMEECILSISNNVGVNPVPIAQTGS